MGSETRPSSLYQPEMLFEELEARFSVEDLIVFTRETTSLLEDSASPPDWRNRYLSCPQLARVVDEARSNELGVYLVSRARELGRIEHQRAAEEGLAILVRIKAFQQTKEYFDPDGLPKEIDQILLILTSKIKIEDEVEIAKKIRSIWGICTPYSSEEEERRNKGLTEFMRNLRDTLQENRTQRILFTDGLFAAWCGVSPRNGLNMLLAHEPDMHYFSNGMTYAAYYVDKLCRLMRFLPFEVDENSIPLPDLGTAEKIATFLQAVGWGDLREAGAFRCCDVLDMLEEIRAGEDEALGISCQKAIIAELQFPDDFEGFMKAIQEIASEVDFAVGERIPLITKDVDRQECSKERLRLLLTDNDLLEVRRKLEQNRIENQRPNSTKEIIKAMDEVFKDREAKSVGVDN